MRTPIQTLAAICLAAAPALAQDAEAGRALYLEFCATCHGLEARGDGVMAEVLTIAPPDLTGLAGGGAFPTLQVAQQVDGRHPLLAHGGDMPLFGRWFEGDGADVALAGPGGQPILMGRPIADLITYLMEIQR
ncbi:c-type cytochrome [Roseicyclus persicicus]|uniref:Cytochrome c n=1 Tax=Roseicyclus persicicus TaxID=2650661 RepID=A0A7X6H1C0_9RHOB|nr:cytochrome c [Roseibacterium persicicum]NKX46232.1 cytochrome c [Roseibacterium persicicum]